MIRPDIEKLVVELYNDVTVCSHTLRSVDILVRYIQHLENMVNVTEPYDAPEKLAKLKLEKQFDPRNVPEFLEIVREQHGKN